MDVCCDLQVDVNGEEVFMINKKIISSFCGRIRKLFGKSKSGSRNLKVIFHDFPGGANNFELMTRFCYNDGKIEVNPYNVTPLYCAANFMEMNESVSGSTNLLEQTEKSVEEIKFWTWSDLLAALKQCQDMLPIANSSGLLQKCLDSLVGRLVFTSETSPSCPSTSSPDSSGFRLSTDTRSTESMRNSFFRATWWFEDLVVLLKPDSVEMLVKAMVLQKFDQVLIGRFLIYYQKSRFVSATPDEKRKITETVIDNLDSLDINMIPCKSLFGILRVALNLSISKRSRYILESMIGSQLDQASLDNLLVPPPTGSNYLYDVNLVLRFVKSFLGKGTCSIQLQKVASLMDSYIAEVVPDPRLKPLKFLALVHALPDSARDSYDGIYNAMDMYLQVRTGLSEGIKMRVCCGLNYEKLSSETCSHLAQNKRFPSKFASLALTSQQSKLKSLIHETNQQKSFTGSPCGSLDAETMDNKEKVCDQIVLYAGKLELSNENEKLRAHLQGMQWRVIELEKVCRKMQTQMTKIMKSRLSSQSSAKSLPRLCS